MRELLQGFDSLIGWQMLPILLFMAIATYTDIKEKKIRNWTNGGMAIFNILLFVVVPLLGQNYKTAFFNLGGGVLAFLLLLLPAAYLMMNMGGDIKMAGAAGIALGPIGAISWICVSAILAGLYSLTSIRLKRKTLTDTMPLAPFFFISLVVHLLASYYSLK